MRLTDYLFIAAAASLVAACGAAEGQKGARKPSGPPAVGFRVMRPATVTLELELPGRVSAWRVAEVRPQITGVIEQRLFTEGALVRAGQPLYRIDQRLYRAAVAQAEANLASARASAEAATSLADRYRPLASQQAVAEQDYTNALAAARQARASVAQAAAAVDTARINLRFTTVPAPITGRIGRSLFTEGALVTGNQADPLAVISAIDPVFVDLQESAGDLIRLRRQMGAAGSAGGDSADVRLTLDDGTDYGIAGQLAFSEVTADPATGTVTLRARFPNPDGLLMPGMFVRARITQGGRRSAFLVPQVALTRDPKGQAQVYIVSKDGKAETRRVETDRTQGAAWVVTAGLREGERVITQGLGKLKPGDKVKPVPETAPQKIGGAKKPGSTKSAG